MVEIETKSGRERRSSSYINRKPAANIHHAIRVADFIGAPLNVLVTINFSHTNCLVGGESQQFELLRDNYFGPWVRRPPRKLKLPITRPAFVWVIEHGGGQTNAHWLLHVPDKRYVDFCARVVAWVGRVTDGLTSEYAVQVKRARTPKGAGKYLLKGIDPVYAEFYGIRPMSQGVVHGKRSGFSRCLGPKARKSVGYAPKKRFHTWPSPTKSVSS